jgi:hypothetical protein
MIAPKEKDLQIKKRTLKPKEAGQLVNRLVQGGVLGRNRNPMKPV